VDVEVLQRAEIANNESVEAQRVSIYGKKLLSSTSNKRKYFK